MLSILYAPLHLLSRSWKLKNENPHGEIESFLATSILLCADNTVALSSMMNIRGLDVANRFNLNSIEVVL